MAYSSALYEEAQIELERRRNIAEQQLDARREELFAKNPRARVIERSLSEISLAAARSVLSGSDIRAELETMKEKSLALQRELSLLLEKEGLGRNWLEPWYSCKKCGDKGFIDGKMCGCMRTLLKQLSFDELNSISPLELSSFDTFDLKYYPANPVGDSGAVPREFMKRVLAKCRGYAANFSPQSRSMIFSGATGLGKTHLSLAIAREVIERGFGVVYVSVPDILSRIDAEKYSYRSEDKYATRSALADCDLLILDDLGTEYRSRQNIAEIYNIINTRIMYSRPLIISTNLNPKDMLSEYDQRLVSRIFGTFDRIEFIGSDVRVLKRRENNNH